MFSQIQWWFDLGMAKDFADPSSGVCAQTVPAVPASNFLLTPNVGVHDFSLIVSISKKIQKPSTK